VYVTARVKRTYGKLRKKIEMSDYIYKYNHKGYFILRWGGLRGVADGQFEDIRGIAVDSFGNMYIADRINRRIQKFDSNGNFISK
jgi:tripartite motif-containing protein 71